MPAQPYDAVDRWLVTSASRPEIRHVVELCAYNGFGACSCEHFQFRIAPHLNAGRVGLKRCAHIIEARNTFTDMVIEKLRLQQRHHDIHTPDTRPAG